jgi:hypothetical protein
VLRVSPYVPLSFWPSHDQWHEDLLPWIEPLATLGAFIAAGIAVVVAWRAYRGDAEETARIRGDQVEREKRAQAEQVAVWWVQWSSPNGPKNGMWPAAMYVNRSGLPIYNVILRLQHMNVVTSSRGDYIRATLEPETEPKEIGFLRETSEKYRIYNEQSPLPYTPNARVSIEFTDAADRRWLRDFDGQLKPVGENRRGDEIWIDLGAHEIDPARVAHFERKYPPGSNLDNITTEQLEHTYDDFQG